MKNVCIYYTRYLKDIFSFSMFVDWIRELFDPYCAIDRLNKLQLSTDLNIKSLNPFKFDTVYDLNTIYQLMDKRAYEIINSNKRVIMCWSGGCDSSSALISLITNSDQHWRKNNLHVVCNEESKQTNPLLYKYIQKNIPYTFIDNKNVLPFVRNIFKKDTDIISSGEFGDNWFGYKLRSLNENIGNLTIQKGIEHTYTNSRETRKKVLNPYNIYDISNEYIKDSIVEINNYNDYICYLSLMLAYDNFKYRYCWTNILPDNVMHYWDSQYFSDWYISNFNNINSTIYSNNGKNHKMYLRRYICNFLKDDTIINDIVKIPSLGANPTYLKDNEKTICILQDGSNNTYTVLHNTLIHKNILYRLKI